MHRKDDIVGRAIFPSELPRILGHKFVSESQVRSRMRSNAHLMPSIIETLVTKGLFVPWIAVGCPACRYVWPYCKTEEEIAPEVFCPMCNETTPTEFVKFYDVYEVIAWPD